MLPGNNEYSGRFTGLTPYQAANKALSKYYREVKNPVKSGIQFSIRESTRGSKRGTYTYSGSREKLRETPITYEIDDGRVITKNFKNRLTKVKKADLEKALLAQEKKVEVTKAKTVKSKSVKSKGKAKRKIKD